jgi:hypothetical protein
MTRPFRFGVVAPLRTDLPTWRARVRRIADAGYSTLLMPDVPQWQPAPGPTLALAAGLANIRVGTWVYASPLRPHWMTAWDAHSPSVLSEGRFEMGVGTARPGIEDELRQRGLRYAVKRPGRWRPTSQIRSRSLSCPVSLGTTSRGWHATSARCATLSSRCTCRLSATRSRRSWLRPIPTPRRFARRTRWRRS